MKRMLLLFSLLLLSCEERTIIDSEAIKDVIITDTESTTNFYAGSFGIQVSLQSSFDVAYKGLLLEGSRDEASPMVSLANIDINYEMRYGSFKPVDKIKKRWTAIDNLELQKVNDREIDVILYNKQRRSGVIRIGSQGSLEGEYLKMTFSESDDYNRIALSFRCEDEAFIGFGAQSIDVNHYGNELYGWVQEQGIGKVMNDEYDDPLWYLMGRKHSSHIPIPQILSSRGFVATIMDDIRPVVSICKNGSGVLRFEFSIGGSLYIFPQESAKRALLLATSVSGRSRLMPDFAFFPWIDAIFGSENVRSIARRLRDYKIPSSVIWTEDYKGGEFRGDRYVLSENWEIDRTLYPDFEELAEDLHNMGFKFLVYFNPFVFVDSDAFSELDSKGLLIKDANNKTYLFDGHKGTKASMLDLLNRETIAWLKSKMGDVIEKGADGWMGDFGEWLPTDAYMYDSESGKMVSGLVMHNRYPVLWQKVQREVIDSYGDKERLFFVRSGWFGTPGLVDVVWAGDQRTTFDVDDGLPTIIPIGLGLGICGISNFGHDIAGYNSVTNPPSTKELFFRWTELGAFSPVMRTHHGYIPLKNWTWDKDEETIELFRRYATIHSRLFPYLKTLNTEASKTGIPVMRPLALEFEKDKVCWDLKDQYMLGESILVAPVITDGARERRLYLPEGRWGLFNQTGRYIEGKRYITIEAPLDFIPVFVREGSIIPMLPEGVITNVDIPNPYRDDRLFKMRTLLLFLGKDSQFVEYNGTEYRLKMKSSYDRSYEIGFEVDNSRLTACLDEKSNCFIRDEQGRYIVYIRSNKTLQILAGEKVIAFFESRSESDFDLEVSIFY